MSRLALLVAAAFFMEYLDGSIIATALPKMAPSLGGTPVELHIGISAYLLAVAVFILPGGWASERFGARRVFTSAIAIFTLGSVLCGVAQSVNGFVAARVLQGIGGAMMVPVGRLAVLRTTEKQDLMRAVALLTWPALSAPLLGPPLGGFISEHFTWRWIFFINLPLGLAGVALALWLVPRVVSSNRQPFDLKGFVLGTCFLLCGTAALDLLGDSVVPWRELGGLSTVAVVSCVLFVRHIHRCPHPMVNPATFGIVTFRAVMVGGTVMRTLISTMPFLLPLLFQLGFGLDPFHAGLLVLALFAGNITIKPLTSSILHRWGFRSVLIGNGLLQAATMLACAFLSPATPVVVIAALLVLSGASRSLQFTAFSTLAFADVPQPSMPSANTLFSVAFQLAIGLGVAFGAVTLQGMSQAFGVTGTPTLQVFHATFAIMALLMAISALDGFRLAHDAGAVVARRT